MRVHDTPTRHTVTFTGLGEFTRAAVAGSEPHGSSRQTLGSNWCDDDWDTTIKKFATGWREGHEAVGKLARVLFTRVTSRTPVEEMRRELLPRENFSVSPEAYITGDPECWLEWHDTDETQEQAGRKLVRVAVDLTASAAVPAATLFARGAATLALVEALEHVGRIVELTAFFAVSDSFRGASKTAKVLVHIVPLKAFGDRPNPDVLACAVAHPGNLRRLHFGVVEGYDATAKAKWGRSNSYGFPIDKPVVEADIHIPSAGLARHWQSPETAEAWVLDALRSQGVTITD